MSRMTTVLRLASPADDKPEMVSSRKSAEASLVRTPSYSV